MGGAGEVEEGLEELAEGWVGAAVRAGVRGLEAAAGEMAASAEGAAEDWVMAGRAGWAVAAAGRAAEAAAEASLVAEAGLGEGAWALEEQAAGLEGMGALVAVVGSAGEVGTV